MPTVTGMNTRTLNMERQPPQDQQAVQWLSELLTHSLELQASDIHLEPFDNLLRVRVRRDGKLYEMPAPAASLREQIISRIKVQSRLDIAEKRLPQDGRLQWAAGQQWLPRYRLPLVPRWLQRTDRHPPSHAHHAQSAIADAATSQRH